MPLIRYRLLGPTEVSVDGGPPPPELVWRKNLALVAYLARSPRRTRSRDHLMGLLWANKPDTSARHSLREAIRILRRALGEDGLVAEHDQVTLADGAVALDIEAFAAAEAAGTWSDAAALVGGEFMNGFGVPDAAEFEDWLTVERAEWKRRSVAALVLDAESRMQHGRNDEAQRLAERAQAIDPGSEPAARCAMRACALAGDRAGALAAHDRLMRDLSDLGVTPDAETAALLDRVRHQRAWRLSGEVPVDPSVGAESRRAPLVGRERPLQHLAEAFEACVGETQATVCVIVGEPGLGKSRLADELLMRARLNGAAVSSVRAVDGDLDTPFSGVHGIARGLLDAPGVAAAAPDALAGLAADIPEWAERFGQIKGSPAPLRRAFIEVVRALCVEQPVVLLADDVQWLDLESLQVFEQALRDLADQPLLILLASRADPPREAIEELRARIGRDLPGRTVTLHPLTDAAIVELVAWAMPSYTAEERDRLTRRIMSDSAGLPLLAVELLHAVALGMDIGAIAGAWPEPMRTLDQSLPGDLPDTIAAAIRVGYRRLSKDAQAVLAAAAVLGGPTDGGRLGRAAGVSDDRLLNALDELEWQRWLSADARGYTFVARIVRDAIDRDMVTAGQRQRMLATD